MVKGISRRVVMVKSPDPEIFDEAIFIVREDALRRPGVTGEKIVSEALSVAENFAHRTGKSKRAFLLPPWGWSILGGAAVGLVWFLTAIF